MRSVWYTKHGGILQRNPERIIDHLTVSHDTFNNVFNNDLIWQHTWHYYCMYRSLITRGPFVQMISVLVQLPKAWASTVVHRVLCLVLFTQQDHVIILCCNQVNPTGFIKTVSGHSFAFGKVLKCALCVACEPLHGVGWEEWIQWASAPEHSGGLCFFSSVCCKLALEAANTTWNEGAVPFSLSVRSDFTVF